MGVLMIVVMSCMVLPLFVCLNGCHPKRDRQGKVSTESYMRKRQKNMQQILEEDFGEECIFKTESGETYAVQMGMYGSVIIVDLLETYRKIKLDGSTIKLKTEAELNNIGQPVSNRLPPLSSISGPKAEVQRPTNDTQLLPNINMGIPVNQTRTNIQPMIVNIDV